MAELNVEKHGNTWRYRFECAKVDGKRKQKSKGGFPTRKAAMDAGRLALMEYNNAGDTIVPTTSSYADFLDQWMDDYVLHNYKPRTYDSYSQIIRAEIKPALGHYKLIAINTKTMQDFIYGQFDNGAPKAHLANIRSIFSGSMKYAKNTMHYIQHDPTENLHLPKPRATPRNEPTRSRPHVFLTQDQMAAIFTLFPEGMTMHVPLMLGYKCGLRRSEAFGLQWCDIDFENKTVTVNRQLQYSQHEKKWIVTPPKYESYRTIDIDDALVELLKREKHKQDTEQARFGARYHKIYDDQILGINYEHGTEIFPVVRHKVGQLGTPRSIEWAVRECEEELGIKFDFHSLRHTHATMLAENGVPIKYIMQRLGHRRATLTIEVYQHVSETMQNESRETIENLFKYDV